MTQLGRERVALPWRRDADRVRDSDAVDAHPVDGGVDLEQVAFGRAEAVLAREASFLAVILDELDDRAGFAEDVVHALAVGELTQVRRRPEQDVDPGHAGLDRN